MTTITYTNSVPDRFNGPVALNTFLSDPQASFTASNTEIIYTSDLLNQTLIFGGTFTNIGTPNATGKIESLTLSEGEIALMQITGLSATISDLVAGDDLFGGAFTFIGSAQDDIFIMGADDDELFGFDGDDILAGNEGRDLIDGGAGIDTVAYDEELLGTQGVAVNLLQERGVDSFGARDTLIDVENITGTIFDDVVFGDAATNQFEGLSGDDSLNGRGGDDVLLGGDGDDTLVGGAGDDTLEGGAGDDLIGGRTGDDVINAGDGDDRVVGQLGDDVIDGGDGADVLNGGVGADIITGGAGGDTILGRNDADIIDGGDGDDALNGGSGEDRITGGAGDDVIVGGADADVFVYTETNFGDDTVFRYFDGVDSFEVSTTLAADFSDVNVVQDGRDAVISFDNGSITLVNRDAAQITEADFSFIEL